MILRTEIINLLEQMLKDFDVRTECTCEETSERTYPCYYHRNELQVRHVLGKLRAAEAFVASRVEKEKL